MTCLFKFQSFALAACLVAASLSGNVSAQTAKPAAAKKPAAAAPVATATLRITCDGKNAKAEISINGAFKGECPFDTDVPAGTVTVKATKSVNKVWELVHEEQFRLGADIAKRVEIVLKDGKLDRQFRADAVARMDVEVEALLSAKEAKQRSELPALERAAEGGDAAAMRRLGAIYKFGLAGSVDFRKAAHWYGVGVGAKDPVSMFEFAGLLTQGIGVPVNEAKSVELLREAAVAGNPGAMHRVANWMYYGKNDLQKNVVASTDYWEKAAEAGVVMAEMSWNSNEYELKRKDQASVDRKSEQLKRTAVDVVRKTAESFEDFDATVQAAFIYRGTFVTPTQVDDEKDLRYSRMTMRYYKKAAATGEAAPIRLLANAYGTGRLTPKDLPTAIRLYRQAAALGDTAAVSALAEISK